MIVFIYHIIFATSMQSKEREEKPLHMLSDFVDMRFALQNNRTYLQEKNRLKRHATLLDNEASRLSALTSSSKQEKSPRPKSLLKLESYGQSESSRITTEAEEAHFRLKYLETLSEEHLIIGNEYQLDMLKIGGVLDGFLDVEHKWSLSPQGVVHSISVERKCTAVLS
jgi:hypothetical protein